MPWPAQGLVARNGIAGLDKIGQWVKRVSGFKSFGVGQTNLGCRRIGPPLRPLAGVQVGAGLFSLQLAHQIIITLGRPYGRVLGGL